MSGRSPGSVRAASVFRRLLPAVATLGACALPSLLLAQAVTPRAQTVAPTAQTLQAGPVYTSADGKKFPEIPKLEIVISPSGDQQTMPKPADLTLTEDGVQGSHATSVTTFDSKGYGLAAVAVIDVSGSMAGRPLNIIKGSLYKFVSDARAQDSVGVVTIADDAVWDVPFRTDQATMKTRLQAMHTRGTKTRLYDGLLTALGAFDSSVPARRELTVISDGHDEGSQSKLEDVVKMARDRGIAIDAIGLTRSAPQYLVTLQKLAATTGGSFHQVRSDPELDSLISNGLARLKATPVASFEAKQITGDGKRHTLGVRWSGDGGISATTAFVAPKQSGLSLMRWMRHIPTWGYAALAVLCFVLLAVVIVTIRHLRKRDRFEDVPYSLPAQPAADSAYLGEQPVQNHYAGEEISHARPGGTAGMASSPPAPMPRVVAAVAPAEQPASRPKQTRLAGVFDGAGSAIARLDILTGAMLGRSVEVQRGEFWIGAGPDNQFVISNDATVSSRHAYLIFEDPILILVDNRSTNGTRVNGKMLRGARQPLRDGDQIQIGQTLLRLRSMG